jgi:diketogulonate reductase-like aldo/keto reductase
MKALPGLVALMSEIGQGHGGKIPSQVALNWLICKGALPIPGAKNGQQAEQNASSIGWRLTPEDVKALDDSSDKFTK